MKWKDIPVSVKATIGFLICGFLGNAVNALTTPIFTRIMLPEEYGKYNVFQSWYNILSIVITFRLYAGVYSQGLIKFDSQRKEYSSSLQGLCITLVLIWSAIYACFCERINEFLSIKTEQMVLMFLLIWLNAVYQFWSMEQRVNLKYRLLLCITILSTILSPVFSIILMNGASDKVYARVLGMTITSVIFYIWLFFSQLYRGKVFFRGDFWIYALRFNLPLLPHYLSMTLLNSVDRIMIEKMVGPVEAGIYGLAYSLSLIMTVFNNAVMQTVEPWLYTKIKKGDIKTISGLTTPLFFIIAVLNYFVILFAPELLSIFAPNSYYDAVWVIPPVSMSVLFMFVFNYFATFEFYFEKRKYILIATMTGAIANILLNYICIKEWGYYAAGYTTLVCFMLFALFHYIFMRKICKKNFENQIACNERQVAIIIISFMFLGFLVLSTYNYPVFRYSIMGISIIALIGFRHVIIKLLKNLLKGLREDECETA